MATLTWIGEEIALFIICRGFERCRGGPRTKLEGLSRTLSRGEVSVSLSAYEVKHGMLIREFNKYVREHPRFMDSRRLTRHAMIFEMR